MDKQKKIGYIGLFLISAVATTLVFQNCSKVNYNIPDSANSKTTGNVNRVLNIDPTFSTENSDMKVLIVVDDSYTMSQSQARLSNAVDSLMDPLFGRNVEFKVVSTSGIPSNEIDYTITKKYYNSSQQEIPQSQISALSSYTIESSVANSINGRHTPLKSLKGYTQNQFNIIKSRVKSTILSVGVNGSDTEEGFCPVVRQLFDTSATSFFKKGDKAAIIIISDEPDHSAFNTCVTKYKEQVSNKPVVYYSYAEQRAKLTLEYQANRDGVTTWIPVTWAVGLPNGQYFNAGLTCNASDVSIATQIITNKGYVVRNVSNCVYEAVQSTRYGADLGDDGTVANTNLCNSQVVFQGMTYSNIYSYVTASSLSAVNGSCQKITQPANSITNMNINTSVVASDAAAVSTQDLKSALITKSNELFGSGFIYASIIRKSNESCALQTGQAYGVNYEALANQLPNNSVVESMCASNFSGVLSNVSQFINSSAANSYVVSGLASGESILAVSVKHNGVSSPLSTSQYETVGSTITLTGYTLQQGDTLEVSVGTL